MTSPFSLFTRTVAESTAHVFETGESPVALSGAPAAAERELVRVSIGFVSEHCQGGVTAMASVATVRALRPADLADAPEVPDRDVLGEMTNMLVGRFKNQLLRKGVVLNLGTPSAEARPRKSDARIAHTAVDLPGGRIYLTVDARFDDHFAYRDADENGPASASVGVEGDILFF